MQSGPRRRSRVPLSCDPCRTRKLKCNREKPCQNCTARKNQANCQFQGPSNGPPASTGDVLRQRIDRLENLVKQLVAEREDEHLPSKPAGNHTSGSGKTVIEGGHSVYLGAGGWHDVLEEIHALKRTYNSERPHWNDEDAHPDLSHTVDGTSLLFNQVTPIDRSEILASLPPRPEVDRLLAHFFDHKSFAISVPPIIHRPTFLSELTAHFHSPSDTPLIWLGLLFSVLGIVMLEYHQHGRAPPYYAGKSEALFHLYRTRTAQCLLAGDITKCQPYTVEALRLNATAELNRKDDNRRGLWILSGVLVRVAVNMGYHRDPEDSTPGGLTSPLAAEYRRRVWVSVVAMEEMASLLTGFPRLTGSLCATTREPRNVHDWELGTEMAALPPSRAMEEETLVTYLIAKGRLSRALGRVTDFNIEGRGDYARLVEIDADLRRTYEQLPVGLKVGALPESGEGGTLATRKGMAKLTLTTMYHQGVCILHRPYLTKDRGTKEGRRHKLSIERCVASALALLDLQRVFFRGSSEVYEMAQGRQLLMLAAMVVVLELEVRRRFEGVDVEMSGEVASGVLMAALQMTSECWESAKGVCEEAARAARLIQGVAKGLTGSDSATTEGVTDAFDFEGLAVRFEMDGEGSGIGKDMSGMEFDWANWDAFIDETHFECGPIY